MSGVALRTGVPKDAHACARILNAWIDATAWMPRCHPPEDVVRHYRNVVLPKRDVTVAEGHEAFLGFIGVDAAAGHITTFYVDEKARRQGVGKTLLAAAKRRWPLGLDLWTFVANTGARRFYAREGFVEVERTDGENEERLPDVRLEWTPVR